MQKEAMYPRPIKTLELDSIAPELRMTLLINVSMCVHEIAGLSVGCADVLLPRFLWPLQVLLTKPNVKVARISVCQAWHRAAMYAMEVNGS